MTRLSVVVLMLFVSFSTLAQQGDRPSQPDLPGDIMLDFGLNMWSEDTEQLRLDLWRSNSFSIYYNRMFKITNKFTFHPAVGLGIEKYAFNDDFAWLMDSQGTISLDTLSGGVSLTKNKLNITYFEIPFELRFYPKGTVSGEGMFVSVGAIGGLRINTNSKIKFANGEGQTKRKLNQRLGVNDFKYGVQARIGFRTFHVFYKHYFSDVFDGSPDDSGLNPTAATLGINFSGF